MLKSQLVALIQAIRQQYSGEINPVGSQSSYAVRMTPSPVVTNSMEGDIIMSDPAASNQLKQAFGRGVGGGAE